MVRAFLVHYQFEANTTTGELDLSPIEGGGGFRIQGASTSSSSMLLDQNISGSLDWQISGPTETAAGITDLFYTPRDRSIGGFGASIDDSNFPDSIQLFDYVLSGRVWTGSGIPFFADVIVDGKVSTINEYFLHNTYRSLENYLETFGRYTTWSANDLYKSGKQPTWLNLTFRPLWRFFRMYILRHGFLDGKHGLILCTLASFSVFMKYAKLWDHRRRDTLSTAELSPKQDPESLIG